MDEFDWGYVGNSREITKKKISSHIHYSTSVDIPYMLIVDVGRDYPEKAMQKLKEIGVMWDACYYQIDNEMELVKCDPTPDTPDTTTKGTT
jgi:putative cell wall-binding protein